MDPNTLLQCFAGTLNHDHSIRTEAESQLKIAGGTPGFLGACLDIISAADIPDNIKLSASLYFKNKILYGWSGKKHGKNELLDFTVDNDEKPVVKDMLVKALVQSSIYSPNCIRLLQPALSTIVGEDYPQKRWDSLLDSSFELMGSNDINSAHIGLLCLSEIFRTFRWKDNDSRQELEHIIVKFFPPLLEFATSNLLSEGRNVENAKVGDMVKLVLKIYKFVTYHDLPFTLQRPENFISWANFHVAIIQQSLPTQILASMDTESRKSFSWIKSKKWAYANMSRLFQRYASTSLSRKFAYDEFKTLYLQEFLPQLLQLFFQQIEQWSSKSLWLSDEAIYHILGYIEQTVIQKATWPLVKPHFTIILEHVIYPLLCPTEKTLETFESDPQEYIHRNLELWDDNYSPDFAALSLLSTCVTKRGKSTLVPTVQFVTEKLKQNLNDFNNSEKVIEAESSLRIISNILDRLFQKNSPFANEAEDILSSFVFPFFLSSQEFLKARVCEICSKLGDYQFRNEHNLQTIYNGIISCFMQDSDCLPVELLAALALQAFIHVPQFQEPISANVVQMTQKLLRISNEIESDAISGVLQEFVECFSEQLQPFGIELMNDLVQQFLKLAIDLQDSSNFDINLITDKSDLPDDTDKQMAALGILSTAISILLSFENSHEIVKSLEQSFYPAAEFILKNQMEDFYGEVCEFLENSTFLLRDISPISWKVLELIGECNRKDESMVSFYLDDFMVAFNNYLVYGQDELKKNQFYSNILFEVYTKATVSDDNGLDEMVSIFELSQKLVLALGPQTPNEYIERFLGDALASIKSEAQHIKENISFSVSAFNVICACLTCYPLNTINILNASGALESFFSMWFEFFVPNYKRVYDIKLSAMALLALVNEVELQDLVSLSVANVLPKSSSMIVKLLTTFPHALKALEEKRKEYSSDTLQEGVNIDWEDAGQFDDASDEDGENDEEYLEFLNKDLKFVEEETNGYEPAESFEDLEEDPLSGSVIDSINVYQVLKSVISALQGDQVKYQAFTSGLSPEDQQSFLQLVNL